MKGAGAAANKAAEAIAGLRTNIVFEWTGGGCFNALLDAVAR
ncbi:hypothetical protein [Paraburkholderia elongata]|nr:hypothetical protein [Paraburkholderia elongata]